MPKLTLYTDGGCRNHGNKKNQHVQPNDKAAWAFIIKNGNQVIQKAQGLYGKTNNQMELQAAIEGLTYLHTHFPETPVEWISDSHYVLFALDKGWLDNWRNHQWQKAHHQPIKNQAQWQAFDQVYQTFDLFTLSWQWVKGHAQNQGNIDVDKLVNDTMNNLPTK